MKTLCSLFLILCMLPASAQLQVSVAMNKNNFMSKESVVATVSITNNSGGAMRLHNESGINWLEFDIHRHGGSSIAHAKNILVPDAIVPAGATIVKKYKVNQFYSMTRPGNYTLRASINVPGSTRQTYRSNPAHFGVNNGAPVYRQTFGVPGDASQKYTHIIYSFNNGQFDQLYFESYSENKKSTIFLYTLGPYKNFRRPQYVMDSQHHTNILFIINEKHYRYFRMSPEGKVVDQRIVEAAKTNPRLVKLPSGAVTVAGGIPYDPTVAKEKKSQVHGITERPNNVFK